MQREPGALAGAGRGPVWTSLPVARAQSANSRLITGLGGKVRGAWAGPPGVWTYLSECVKPWEGVQ